MDEVDVGFGFTTYDHRTCTYQPQQWNETEFRCDDIGEAVTSDPLACKGEQTPACPTSGGGPQ